MKELYKVLLVDDEDEIRGRIASMISEDIGFQIVGSASNGYDALELIEKTMPDVVLTDIRMPFIDGIELAKILRTDFPDIKVAFLSGFSEFDYARKAIELNVVSYLMKPVTKPDVLDLFRKLLVLLDKERNMDTSIETLDQSIENNKQIFVEKQLNEYLVLTEINEDELKKMNLYGYNFEVANYIVGIFEFTQEMDYKKVLESELFIREYMEKDLTNYQYLIPFSSSEGLSFVMKHKALSSIEMENTMNKIVFGLRNYNGVHVRVGLSDVFSDFSYFPSKFKEAAAVLSICRFSDSGDIIFYDTIQDGSTVQAILTSENIKELEYVIRFGSEQDIQSTFDKYIRRSMNHEDRHVDFQLYIITSANIILNYALSIGVKIETVVPNGLLTELLNRNSIEEILTYAKDIILLLRQQNIDKSNSRMSDLSDRMIDFIERSYDDSNLSLERVAQEFNVSVSYLSGLLRKEKNTTFSKYLIKKRIEKAKELLRLTNLKIVEVAKKVGYNDVYYFSHSFKKNTSMSPKEFREHETN
jgi:two-component system response regulator YesN